MNSQSSETDGQDKTTDGADPTPAIKTNESAISGEPTASKSNDTSRSSYWEKRQYWVQATIAAVGTITVVIYGCQLREMRKSTDAATKAANAAEAGITNAEASSHLDQRAWVSATIGQEVPQIGKVFTITVTAKNSGKTFARRLKVFSVIEAMESDAIPDFSTGRKLAAKKLASESSKGGSVSILPPNVEYITVQETNLSTDGTNKPLPLTQEVLDDFVAHKYRFFAYGWLTYFDIFGCDHWTIFCNELVPGDSPGTFKWITYSTHNDADVNQCTD